MTISAKHNVEIMCMCLSVLVHFPSEDYLENAGSEDPFAKGDILSKIFSFMELRLENAGRGCTSNDSQTSFTNMLPH